MEDKHSNLLEYIRARRAALAGFMKQGAKLRLDGDLLEVTPLSQIYVRYLSDNLGVIGAFASEMYGRGIRATMTDTLAFEQNADGNASGSARASTGRPAGRNASGEQSTLNGPPPNDGQQTRPRKEPSRQDQLLAAALWYASKPLNIFPCWWIQDGHCACGNCGCDACNSHRREAGQKESDCSPGKHPIGELVPRGVLDASIYPETIKRWWKRYPLANLALACGRSGLIVADIDPRHGGDEVSFWAKSGARVDTVRTLTRAAGSTYGSEHRRVNSQYP